MIPRKIFVVEDKMSSKTTYSRTKASSENSEELRDEESEETTLGKTDLLLYSEVGGRAGTRSRMA